MNRRDGGGSVDSKLCPANLAVYNNRQIIIFKKLNIKKKYKGEIKGDSKVESAGELKCESSVKSKGGCKG